MPTLMNGVVNDYIIYNYVYFMPYSIIKKTNWIGHEYIYSI